MAERETVAAADLIPGDVIVPDGDEVTGYPFGKAGRTAVPVNRNGLEITHFVDSEKPFEVIR